MMTDEAQYRLIPHEPNLDAEFHRVAVFDLPTNEEIGPPEPEKSMVDSVWTFGIRQTVFLAVEFDDKPIYTIVAGRRRIQAARKCVERWAEENPESNWRECPYVSVPAMVGEDREGLAALDVQLNTTPKPNEFAYLDRITEMAGNASEKEIARATAMPVSTVRRLIAVGSNLDPALMKSAREGHIAFSVAEAASKLAASQQRSLLEVLAEKGRVTGKDVAEAKRAYHESFQGEIDLGLDQVPTYEEEASAQEEALAASDRQQQEAVGHLTTRLWSGPASEGRRMWWTKDDLDAVEVLLRRYA